ncbi:hypothetical protein F5Y10DRAFT_264575 [Nemania abortiva]|nr:hypothetical protein F5Y10DRAFT_264575 [Nemania abortiva]
MSAVKFNYPTYKLFEPQYHPQRPIIIDADAIESPETVTLRYEEEAAARANGGDPRGDSPPGLLGIEACPKQEPPPMHSAFESPRSYQDPQYPYAGQSFPTQQPENAAATQLNHLAFGANNSTGTYMPPVGPTVTSYQPTSGGYGTKMTIKISVPYGFLDGPGHFFLAFGSQRSPAHAVRDDSDTSGLGYVVSGDAPQPEDTRIMSDSVPISLLVEGTNGQTLASIDVGTFTYDTQVVKVEGPHEDITRRLSAGSAEEDQHQHQHSQQHQHQPHHHHQHQHQHHHHHQQQQHQQRATPPRHQQQHQQQQQEADQLNEAAAAVATNTYPYASTPHQAVASSYEAPGYANSSNNNNMLSTYPRHSYGAEYPRPPPLLKTSSWYGHSLTSPRSPPGIHHTIARSTVTALPVSTSAAPTLIRTSTLQTSGSGAGGSMNPYALYSTKAVLKINGDLESMANNWTPEEMDNGRRLVLFSKKQQGSTLSTTFKAVSASERPPNSICISCIYWAEKRECFVTSVDTISLLEQLLAAPSRFTVDEKNRIRRNLEGFRPLTVSKAKAESEEFFKVIMGFPNPKPRNIEKDVKVFPWKILAPALKKIISKYSASPPDSAALHLPPPPYHASSGPPLLTPVSTTSPGLYAPPPHTPTITDTSYPHHDSQTLASPRSLSGAPSSWGPYTARTLSPSIKPHSPQPAGIRMPSLPAYTNHSAHSYGMPPHGHRWDPNGYGDAPTPPPAYASHQHSGHVYGTSAYASSGHHRE